MREGDDTLWRIDFSFYFNLPAINLTKTYAYLRRDPWKFHQSHVGLTERFDLLSQLFTCYYMQRQTDLESKNENTKAWTAVQSRT